MCLSHLNEDYSGGGGVRRRPQRRTGLSFFVFVFVHGCAVVYILCVEMRPQWYKLDSIPFDSMWADDRYWFPRMLSSEQFYGYFTYCGMDTILSHQLSSVTDFKSLTVPHCPSHLEAGC